eukprot:GHVU01066904.1.p2 GENE.GHVU01066904.1~~GHVU01066904.1.p2  ORF type:complete len:124 (-),score=3.18 GHVU01066904.1:126-497(-)
MRMFGHVRVTASAYVPMWVCGCVYACVCVYVCINVVCMDKCVSMCADVYSVIGSFMKHISGTLLHASSRAASSEPNDPTPSSRFPQFSPLSHLSPTALSRPPTCPQCRSRITLSPFEAAPSGQ